ncbi:tubulin--tyrosine ligase-like protein 12 [Nilaparvata lugens]|uniref:tubulin--tyrosine ligase-like protein 12 n=1 Tax=Nilaparvata lugens TaxID=108931 RepID=UPI00193CEEC8|nr:tubulin--tyrosine ligase-like protein 12 [Nilaparvata lugens]
MNGDIRFGSFIKHHKHQLISSGIPEHFWSTLFIKLSNNIFDAGSTFSIMVMLYDEDDPESQRRFVVVSSENGISKSDPKQIYLIDHAWTYKLSEAKEQLLNIPELLDRMCKMMKIDPAEPGIAAERVYSEMWLFNQTYSIASGRNIEDRLPVWYIMDEFGCTVQHSNNPNFRIVPFAYAPEGETYSILFPIKDVNVDEEVTRDYVEGYANELHRECLLTPWFPQDFKHINFLPVEPSAEYFMSGRLNESLPVLDLLRIPAQLRPACTLKVYADYKYVNMYLTDPRFEIVNIPEEAHILWYTSHFTDFETLSTENPHKYVNQFPYEFVLTVKDLLSVVCRRTAKGHESYNTETLDIYPLWLPETFNLNTELPQFISYYQNREEKDLDNHWICKPWNLARGLDTIISDNLNMIVRLSCSGPKIAQKYIHDPILFHRPEVEGSGLVKFDIRYIIVLKSVEPLEVYAYKNFFLRFANKPFELNDFDDYEKHFTVMNYTGKSNLKKMLCDEFVEKFEERFGDQHSWDSVEKKIFAMIKEIFEAAISEKPPCGIPHSPQSRAVYGMDMMLSYTANKDIQPKVLEINWIPDCQRACEYYNDFYNDIFALCFLNEERPVFEKL